jgi:hypothetical protein
MSFLVGIIVVDAYSLSESSTNLVSKSFLCPSFHQCSFHVTQPIWFLKNKGIIIQNDAYLLPLEFAQLLEAKAKQ